jgi:steroid 5-alpha reductase family enzyme
MTDYDTVLLASAAAIAAHVLVIWLLSLWLRDASIFDVAWGFGFVLVAWVSFALADGAEPRKALVVALTTIWGVRLGVHLAWRAARSEEDFRWRELRARHGRGFAGASLGHFAFQGLGMWVISLPVQAAQVPGSPADLTAVDFAALALWTLGFAFEAVGDLQLARFRADPRNRGKVMDRGLWRYTRHPNYFGDFCVWWGLYGFALATGEAWWSVAGPLMMSCILLRMSGVTVMDRHLSARPGYAEYKRRTSAFLPRPPGPAG